MKKLSTLEEFTNMKGSNDKTQLDKQLTPEETKIDQIPVSRTEEFLMSHTRETNSCSDIIIDNIFAFQVAFDIIRNNEDLEPWNMEECRHRIDWPKWKEATQAELYSLTKQEVFTPVGQMLENIKPIGYK